MNYNTFTRWGAAVMVIALLCTLAFWSFVVWAIYKLVIHFTA